MRKKISEYFTHRNLREIANTLNCFNFIEVSVVLLFCYLAIDMLMWYKAVMVVEYFDGVSFWGAMVSIIGAIFAAIKYINDTRKNHEE